MSYIPSGLGSLYIADSSNNLHKIRLHSRAVFTPGEAATATRQSLDENEAERSSVGGAGHGTFEFDFEPNPIYESYRLLEQAFQDKQTRSLYEFNGVAEELLENGVNADTLAIAVDGALTAAGAISLGSEAAPTPPWTQGLGIVIGNVLYSFDEVYADKRAKVSRYGAVAAGTGALVANADHPVKVGQMLATPDKTALAAVNATHSWKLVQCRVVNIYSGRVSIAGGKESSGAGETASSGTLVLASRKQERMVLPA